ncbi:MAG: phage tail sheath subtilisin-like domain-containing protein [bacterium]
MARAAELVLHDGAGNPTLLVRARDPGTWGNGLRATVQTTVLQRTFLTRDADVGERILQVKSAHGLASGTLVQIQAGETTQWTVVARVQEKTVTLAEPLRAAFPSAAPTHVTAFAFDLVVGDLERTERFEALSVFGNSPRFVERVNDISRLIHVTALRPDALPELAQPVAVEGQALLGGSDGVDNLGPEDFIGYDRGPGYRRGLMCLVEHPDIDLLVMPDLMAAWQKSERFRSLRDVEAVQEAAISLCERSANRFAILDMPPGGDVQEALRWRRQFDSSRAGLYFPWLVVLEGGSRRIVPPSGHVAGIFARSDRGHGVHKAPANEVSEGVVDLSVLLQDQHLALLYESGINCIRSFSARGLRLWGARTLSSDPEWRYVNVRRTVSAISQAIENGTQWAVFEPNGPDLWKRLSRMVSAFLMELRDLGVLTGATPEEAFFVQCDKETNPPEQVSRGMLVTRIGLAVSRPVEFIVFRLAQRLENEAQSMED